MNKSMKKNIQHFFLLTAFAAETIHLVNRFIDITADMKNILKTENGNYYDWKNGKIYYTKRGNGSPVLLIHELNPISSSYEWCRFAKKLEKNHTVYTLDLLGCGRSEKPYLTYTNYLYVQLITDFVKNMIGEKTDVITTGNSISFAALANNMNQNLFRRIIAINPPMPDSFNKTPDKYSTWKKTLLELPIIGTFLYNIKTHEKNIEKVFQENYFARPQLISSKMLDAYYEAAHMNHSHGKYLMASLEGNYIDNSILHVLKKLETPLYIVESNKSQNAVAIANAYRKQNRSIETAYLSNSKLLPQLEAPDKLLDIVTMLLQK